MRCPNYTGFKTRLGARAAEPPAADAVAESVAPAQSKPDAVENRAALTPKARVAKLVRAGRDLQKGVASWYGPGFHGRTTANGEKFDMYELTAAHKTLPFGTRVVVHNPRNGKEVVVRINDRGPYAKGRILDLSKAAASALGFSTRGHDAVVLREALPGARAGDIIATSAAAAE